MRTFIELFFCVVELTVENVEGLDYKEASKERYYACCAAAGVLLGDCNHLDKIGAPDGNNTPKAFASFDLTGALGGIKLSRKIYRRGVIVFRNLRTEKEIELKKLNEVLQKIDSFVHA